MAPKNKAPRTNSMRLLEARGMSYQTFTFPPKHHSALEVAHLAGVPPDLVYKTLVVLRKQGKPCLVMVPGDRELDLKLLAAAIDEKKVKMASQRQAERLTGLQVGGISALALLQKGFDIYIDRTALDQDQIYVSAGRRGVNLRLTVRDLIQVTQAQTVEASSPPPSNQDRTGPI